MINYVVYELATGEIKARYSTNECDAMEQLQYFSGCEIYLNCPECCTHIVNGDPVTIERITTNNEALILVRRQRDLMLKSCDWTQVADSPLSAETKAAWSAYRQALRDLPGNCDPHDPIWPVAP